VNGVTGLADDLSEGLPHQSGHGDAALRGDGAHLDELGGVNPKTKHGALTLAAMK